MSKGKIKLATVNLKLLQVMADLTDEKGTPPTLAEIRDALKTPNTTTVLWSLSVLERYGYIRHVPNIARGRSVTPMGRRHLRRFNNET